MTPVTGAIGASVPNRWTADRGGIALNRSAHGPSPITVDALPVPFTFDLARTAIVIVDMQNDFCHPNGWLASIGVDVAPARTPIPVLAEGLSPLRDAGVAVIWPNWGTRPDRANLPPDVEDASATTSPLVCWDATTYNVRQCFGVTSRLEDIVQQTTER